MTEGIGGVWTYIKDMLGNLAETVLETIRNWVITKVITAGVMWVLSLLNPASAFVRACKLIIDVVMFFIERGSQIISLVNAVLDSISAIASGAIGAMASAVEGALARAVPVAISFLASLLGLGGISDMIRGAIEKIQAPVNKAIDWLIGKAVKLAKAIGGLFGGKKKKEEETPETADPEHDAKVQVGLADLHATEQGKAQGGLERAEAEAAAAAVRAKHPVFQSITVEDGPDGWVYDYVASPGKKEKSSVAADEQCNISIVRSDFTAETREALFTEFPEQARRTPKGRAGVVAGFHRRHIISSHDMASHYEEVLNALKVSEAAELLKKKGDAPQGDPPTNEAVQAAAQARHERFFNEIRNLFVGEAGPNVALQQRADWAHMTDAERKGHLRLIKKSYALNASFVPSE
jgi:hypothetical protein